jgi:hypothetical protein
MLKNERPDTVCQLAVPGLLSPMHEASPEQTMPLKLAQLKRDESSLTPSSSTQKIHIAHYNFEFKVWRGSSIS